MYTIILPCMPTPRADITWLPHLAHDTDPQEAGDLASGPQS